VAPLVLIYHTHSEEAFLPELPPGTPAGSAFSDDQSRDVVRVGAELADALFSEYGIPVAHLTTRFDQQGRMDAFVRSLAGVSAVLRQYPTLHILLDVHRDDAPRAETTATVDGRSTARIMIVVGDNETLPEPDWQRNAAWAAELAQAIDRAHPGLLRTYQGRPYYSDGGRFNQQLSPAALLFEIGGQDNTLAEELRAADLLAGVLAGMIRAGDYPR
jgi:stage II sporulation protein P